MKRIYSLYCLLCLLSCRAEAQTSDLYLKLKNGDCFELTVEQNNEKISYFKQMQFNVLRIQDSMIWLSVCYKSLNMDIMQRKYSSADEIDKLNWLNTSNLLAFMVDKPFSVQLSNRGKVLKIDRNDKIIQSYKKKIKKVSKELQQGLIKQIEGFLSTSSLNHNFEQIFDFYPDASHGQDKSWTKSFNEPDFAKSILYHLAGQTDSTFIITGTGNIEQERTDTTTIHTKMNGRVIISEWIEVETATGLPQKRSSLQETTGEITLFDTAGNIIKTTPFLSNMETTLFIKPCHE
jgi:hypothetical protein